MAQAHRAEQPADEPKEALAGEVLDFPNQGAPNVAYRRTPMLRQPEVPQVPRSFMSRIFGDSTLERHSKRINDIIRLGESISCGRQVGLALDVEGTRRTNQATEALVDIVRECQTQVAIDQAADMAGISVRRNTERHYRYQDIYDSEVENIITRK